MAAVVGHLDRIHRADVEVGHLRGVCALRLEPRGTDAKEERERSGNRQRPAERHDHALVFTRGIDARPYARREIRRRRRLVLPALQQRAELVGRCHAR